MRDADAQSILEAVITQAIKSGAHASDAVMFDSQAMAVSYRLGKLENVERSESRDLGLRVIVGKRQAAVSSSDTSPAAVAELVERAVAMAKIAPEDPYCGLAPDDRLQGRVPDLDLLDPNEPDANELRELAAAAESAALAVPGVTNSDGADASWSRGGFYLATSAGFYGGYASTRRSISCTAVAEQDGAMERDYDFASTLHAEDLKAPAKIGRGAGERAVRRLGGRKIKGGRAPVVYEGRLAGNIVSHLAGALNGGAVARGVSFLKSKLGEQIMPSTVCVVDDPHRKRGLGSKPFDDEGVKNRACTVVENGVLKSWFLNSSQARQLKMETTGHATRGAGGPPGSGPANLYIENGVLSPDELTKDIAAGLFVTDMFGPSVNPNTGDYSVGVSGYWIDNGELSYPVHELTIAGNLLEMYQNMTPANDLEFQSSVNAPTLRIDSLTIAGA